MEIEPSPSMEIEALSPGPAVPVADTLDLRITDLPVSILYKVAARLSGGSLCTEATLPDSATFTAENWIALSEFRATCRLFRDAARVAVGGLIAMPIGTPSSYLIPKPVINRKVNITAPMPLETVLALPQLRFLNCYYTTYEVFTKVPNLKTLWITQETFKVSPKDKPTPTDPKTPITFASADTLQHLYLHSFEPHTTKIFLHDQTHLPNLISLNFAFATALQPLPPQIQTTLKKLTFLNCKLPHHLFQSFPQMTSLADLSLSYCHFENLQSNLTMISQLPALKSLHYIPSAQSRNNILEQTIISGGLNHLQEMTYFLGNADCEDEIMIEMMSRIAPQLKELTLSIPHYMVNKFKTALAGIQLGEGKRFTLYLLWQSGTGRHDPFSMRNLLGMTGMTELFVQGLRVEHVKELEELEELSTVIFTGCWLKLDDAEGLRREGKKRILWFLKCKKLEDCPFGEEEQAEYLDNQALCIPRVDIGYVG